MPTYGRAIAMVTSASLLVPVVGLATAPVLAHSLGAAGRGQVGAALAPNLLVVGGATLGLPQALTYILAKEPRRTRSAVLWASMFALVLGVLFVVATIVASPFLADGDTTLASFVVLATWLALPALLVGLLRGAALGRQMFKAVALERATQSLLKLVLIVGLAISGSLSVLSAVLVMAIAPIVSGMVYLPLLLRTPERSAGLGEDDGARYSAMPRQLLSFGTQEWIGSVAVMLMARMSQLLVAPLSDVTQLGLLLVAVTISDLPYLVTQTVRDVAFGVSSAREDTVRLTMTSRVATLFASAGSLIIGASLPLWISFAFGADFADALIPTWLLLVSASVAVPGLLAGAGLDASGLPARRSFALLLALIVTIVGTVLLTPPLGAVGAASAALAATLVSTSLMVWMASRVLRVAAADFLLPRRHDLNLAVEAFLVALRRGKAKRPEDV